MSIFLSYTFPPGNVEDVMLFTPNLGAGNLPLNGNLSDPLLNIIPFSRYGYNRQLSITSQDDLSGVTFTVIGMENGIFISEEIAGPNAGTVYGTMTYDTVTSISVNNPITQVSIGTGWLGYFTLINVDHNADTISYNLSIVQSDVTGATQPTYISMQASAINLANNGYTYHQNIYDNWNTYNVVPTIGTNDAPNQQICYASNIPWKQFLVLVGSDASTIGHGVILTFSQCK